MTVTTRELDMSRAVLDLVSRPADLDVLELLYDLTAYAAAFLPVRAGITVLDDGGDVAYLTASDELCRRFEQDQLDLDEGPCLDSARTHEPLPVALLDSEQATARWPRFAPRAVAASITAVAAIPLHTPDLMLGALNLISTGPPLPSGRDLHLVQVLADAAALALTHRRDIVGREETIRQLQTALDSRIVIEQAKGVLAARLQVTMDASFTLLRGHARATQQPLTVLATRIAHRDIPDALLEKTR
ncbi:GAF and ANTAR domain-containing protein [Streptomyces kunmingensis]|uniref:GAF and ANTAR domain-containing protein n=1 Tax=Streptomyces kunmingensis TaxID=68225 RepID=A0ABU6C229_9ACTN|nr:GAF and ANTAR domain-containing protein [Streptomyces kunmingensis]MEB3958662.1 GAF and ANTAR domain-containing protein [Streptomyces kunmingensis]